MNEDYKQSIFWIDVEKIKPNPYQPRREFNEASLTSLSDSIKQYGVLQPLVVTRTEYSRDDGGIGVEYELIAGERRLRASKLAGISQVPAVIRSEAEGNKAKLELAIIENIQREDLNPVDRAVAFEKLVKEFNMKHSDVAKKIGKSREYVSNSIRILMLPEASLQALREGKITEGHARPLLMLTERPDEQSELFKEILHRKITVREAEAISRSIAKERARKQEHAPGSETYEIEGKLADVLGTRVYIEKKGEEGGGKIHIEFFNEEDLKNIMDKITHEKNQSLEKDGTIDEVYEEEEKIKSDKNTEEGEDDIYSIKNFSI
jgi:ParB family transcriptional regulator, chromosome partitioning protein